MQDITEFKHFLSTDADAQIFLRDSRAEASVTLARAPGRLDVMGGVADYSGALVAEMTIAEAALVALAPRTDRQVRVWSRGIEAEGLAPQVTLSLDEFRDHGALLSYEAVHAKLRRDAPSRWAAYLFGCFYVLLAEGVIADFPPGANLILDSHVPLGAGVSSSAAIEVATMQAINAAYDLGIDGVTLARLAQTVENRVVGAPCGIMDQMSSALGVENSLLLILCQPHEVQGTQSLPAGVQIYGINSNVKHSVGGGAYTRARVAAFMGRKILGVDYLVNLSGLQGLDSFLGLQRRRGQPEQLVPHTILGKDFLATWGETGDSVTRIDSDTVYNVYDATKHAFREHWRVKGFIEHLSKAFIQRPIDTTASPRLQKIFQEKNQAAYRNSLIPLGSRMYESHASYTSIGLGCEETDLLVELGREAGPTKGIYGAKITGGGSGGTVAFLTYGELAEQTVHEIADTYQAQTGLTPQIFLGGQSPGAMAFGSERI